MTSSDTDLRRRRDACVHLLEETMLPAVGEDHYEPNWTLDIAVHTLCNPINVYLKQAACTQLCCKLGDTFLFDHFLNSVLNSRCALLGQERQIVLNAALGHTQMPKVCHISNII
jgi:hypothetical protein